MWVTSHLQENQNNFAVSRNVAHNWQPDFAVLKLKFPSNIDQNCHFCSDKQLSWWFNLVILQQKCWFSVSFCNPSLLKSLGVKFMTLKAVKVSHDLACTRCHSFTAIGFGAKQIWKALPIFGEKTIHFSTIFWQFFCSLLVTPSSLRCPCAPLKVFFPSASCQFTLFVCYW